MNPDASFCEKVEGSWAKAQKGALDTFKVPFGTPKVPNGALGCRMFFRVQVRFGLFF